MTRIQILAVPLPPASSLASTPADYTDAYQVRRPAGTFQDAASATQLLLGQAPAWVRRLLQLRDWLVRPFRLTTFPEAARPLVGALPVAGGRLGPFRVFSVTRQEVILGLDDRHLNFRVSVLLTAAGSVATVSTLVWVHNGFGRLYFAVIRPFHHRVVPALLRHALRPATFPLAAAP